MKRQASHATCHCATCHCATDHCATGHCTTDHCATGHCTTDHCATCHCVSCEEIVSDDRSRDDIPRDDISRHDISRHSCESRNPFLSTSSWISAFGLVEEPQRPSLRIHRRPVWQSQFVSKQSIRDCRVATTQVPSLLAMTQKNDFSIDPFMGMTRVLISGDFRSAFYQSHREA